jgi:glycosyltransferase involved in cell wall biosynthesis
MSHPKDMLAGDVDSPRPIRATGGHLILSGWCFQGGSAHPPEVRLAGDGIILAAVGHQPRPDLVAQWPDEPAAAEAGFTVSGRLPAGIHLVRLEAATGDGMWRTFKTVCIASEEPPFAAGLDTVIAEQPLTQRIHLEGWALQPESPVNRLTLRYGHQEIPCTLGRPREDLAGSYSVCAHAGTAGFKSQTILSAGRGPLRLKARLGNGRTAIARLPVEIAVPTDENHGPELNLSAKRIGLEARIKAANGSPPRQSATRRLNLLFILPGSFASNSALHVAALANELTAQGHSCLVAVSHDLNTLAHHLTPTFRGLLHSEVKAGLTFPNGHGPTIVHAWTTRETVRRVAESIRQRHPAAKVIVHLEDNESQLLALRLDRTPRELSALSMAELDAVVPHDLSHPYRSHEFLAAANGITVITDRLLEFVPSGRPHQLLWPAADARYFIPQRQPSAFRQLLNRHPGEVVLFYHGNVHAANATEMRELYSAVQELNRTGLPTTLIRTGQNAVDFLGPLAAAVSEHILELGLIEHHHHLPSLMALADFFVQPGAPDAFNDYRFPSKLPEFFAIGRPVILPRTNLGLSVRHGQDAYVLERADAAGIAQAVMTLRADPSLCDRLSKGAVTFAERNFSWPRAAGELAKFYASLTA